MGNNNDPVDQDKRKHKMRHPDFVPPEGYSMKPEIRSATIIIKVPPHVKKAMMQLADDDGISLNEYVYEMLLDRLHEKGMIEERSKPEKTEGEFYSVPEVAEMLGVTRLTVYRWLESGRLHAEKRGQWKVTREDIDNAVEVQKKHGKHYTRE